jgi:hypothetical protein
MSRLEIHLKHYQAEFHKSTARFCAMIASIGTGKTLMMLLKVWQYCELYPNSLALVVRKEFTDLRDSTIKDFESYFGVSINTSSKDFKFSNGSTILFRHAAEMAVLKNMNLSIIGIEQAEEFDSEETWVFLNDRLRRKSGPYRQMIAIANANGHNWLWRLFIQKADKSRIIDQKTRQVVHERTKSVMVGDELVETHYCCVEANLFANIDILPKDFVASQLALEETAPNHFQQYVMNNHDEVDVDDLLLNPRWIYDAPKIDLPYQNRIIKRVMGLDVARFGNDETVFTIIEQKDIYRWEQVFLERYKKKDTIWVSGYTMELERRFDLDLTVVDDVGLGGGVTDNLRSNHNRILPFIANKSATASKQLEYIDCNDEGFFMMAALMSNSWLKLLPDHDQDEQLMTIRYNFKRHGGQLKKHILTKEEMRVKYKEVKSPDIAKALMMAVYGTDKRPSELEAEKINLPSYGNYDKDIATVYSGRDGFNRHQLPTYGRAE